MTALKTNLKHQVKQTPLPKWKPLIPVFEAVMNSIQSIAEREPNQPGRIVIELHRQRDLLADSNAPVESVTITDNGIGLDDDNFDSFNTAFSDWKEAKGGKGLGRFTWLKAFETVDIDTTFAPAGEELQRRQFEFTENYDPDDANPADASGRQVGMKVRLIEMKEPYRSQFPKTTDQFIQRLVEHFLLIFLEPNCSQIAVIDNGQTQLANDVFERDFKATARVHRFTLKGAEFTLHGFRLTTPRISNHKLVYAANQRGVVSDYLRDYIPNLSTRLTDENNNSFVYLAIVQSPYLTQRVNPARTDFEIGGDDADAESPDLFEQEIKRSEIRDEAIKYIHADLADVIETINKAKETRIREYVQTDAPQYKILMKYSEQFINKITPAASKTEIEVALHRELYEREISMKREGSRIIKEAEKLDYDDYAGYHKRLQEFMDTYNELGTAALAQYVMHRKIILEFLQQAISRSPETNTYPLEDVVHSLVFPMRSTDEDIPYHEQNLWIIDERLTFHSFISSDKRLDAIPNHLESDSAKRPDLAIFDQKIVYSDTKPGQHPINSITIVEFKRPGRNDYTADDNPVMQSIRLVEQIRAGKFIANGRPVSVANDQIPATAYAVADITDTLRTALIDLQATPTPDKQGYYGYHRTRNVFYEVIDYNKLLREAEKRNRIFFDKLNIVENY
jgi:hypothetical protein